MEREGREFAAGTDRNDFMQGSRGGIGSQGDLGENGSRGEGRGNGISEWVPERAKLAWPSLALSVFRTLLDY